MGFEGGGVELGGGVRSLRFWGLGFGGLGLTWVGGSGIKGYPATRRTHVLFGRYPFCSLVQTETK